MKIGSLPEEYSQLSTFLSDVGVYYTPKCNNPLKIPNLNFSILIEAVQQVIECLDTTVPLNHGWALCHVSQKRCKRRRKDFISVLLFLREKVHTLSMQYHCMNIVTNAINKLRNHHYYCMATLFQVVGYISYLQSAICLHLVSRLSSHQ